MCLIIPVVGLRYFVNSFPIIYKVYQVSKNSGITKGLKYLVDIKRNLFVIYTNTNDAQMKYYYRISRTIRRTFFPKKCDLKSTCVLYAEGKYLFPNLWVSWHLYREIVKFASKSWDLASLLVNGLHSYPGIYLNVYIASHVIPGIYAAAVAKCSKVMFSQINQWMLKVLRQLW